MLKKVFIPMVLGALFLGSCKQDDRDEPQELSVTKDIQKLNATSYDKWVYFSFGKGEIVEVADPENDLSWDIALQRWYIKTNSGTSGKKGKGGAINTKATNWNLVSTAPIGNYKVDQMGILKGWDVINNVETKKEGSFSQEASLYVDYISGGKYKVRNEVYVLKTANGGYAKIQFYDYTNEKLKGGYPSFRYKLSTDGKF